MITIYPFSKVSPDQVFARPEDRRDVAGTVSAIIDDVRRCGDEALIRYAREFDKAELTALEVPADKGQEELLRQLRVEGAHLLRGDVQLAAEHAPAGEIYRRQDQGLVHGQRDAAVALHAPQVPQGLGKGVPQADADVLHLSLIHI